MANESSGNKSAGNSANVGQIFEENDVLCFRTIGYYESIVNFENGSKMAGVVEFINNSNFASYDKSAPVINLFEEEFIGAILNANRVVKIGEWFMSINPESDKVFVVSDEIEGALELVMEEDDKLNSVIVFSTDDDVLEILKVNNGDTPHGLGCGETNAPTNNVTHAWDEYCDRFEVKFKAKYGSFGIIKKLQLEFWHNQQFSLDDATNFSFGYRYMWKKKCKNESADVTHLLFTTPFEFTNDHWTLTFYSGTHSLSKYYIGNSLLTGGPSVAYKNRCTFATSTLTLVNYLKHGY